MKKFIILGLAVFLIFGAYAKHARAYPFHHHMVMAAGGTPFASSALFAGAVGFGLFAEYMIATGQPFPLCEISGVSCTAEYPSGASHVYVQTLHNYNPASYHVDDFDHPVLRGNVLSSY